VVVQNDILAIKSKLASISNCFIFTSTFDWD